MTTYIYNARWIEPPVYNQTRENKRDFGNNRVYRVGDRILLKWYTMGSYSTLVLNQENEYEDRAERAASNVTTDTRTTEHNWLVDLDNLDLDDSKVFYLSLYTDNKDGTFSFVTSSYFNITTDEVIQTSSILEPSPTSFSLSSLPPTSIPESSCLPSPRAGLSTGATAGISVAGTLFVAFAFFALLWCFRRHRAQNKPQPRFAGEQVHPYEPRKHDQQWQSASQPTSPGQTELPVEGGHPTLDAWQR